MANVTISFEKDKEGNWIVNGPQGKATGKNFCGVTLVKMTNPKKWRGGINYPERVDITVSDVFEENGGGTEPVVPQHPIEISDVWNDKVVGWRKWKGLMFTVWTVGRVEEAKGDESLEDPCPADSFIVTMEKGKLTFDPLKLV